MNTPRKSSWLVCTGPLTNAALLLSTYEDEICDHLAGICFMGGAVASGNCNSGVEFNMFADPESAKIVIETWGEKLHNLVMVPLDVTETALTTRVIRERMGKLKGSLALTISQLWERARIATAADCDTDKFMFDGEACAVIHDPCAIMYVWLPELFEGKKFRVDVETQSKVSFGSTVVDVFGRTNKPKNVFVC